MSNRREPWRNVERHYCAACNVWMGSDRQSIMLHDNGRKHKEKVEESLQNKRADKLQEENNAKLLKQTLANMEQAAMQSVMKQDGFASSSIRAPVPVRVPSYAAPMPVPSATRSAYPPPPPPPPPGAPPGSSKQEKKEWDARKKKRQDSKKRPDDNSDEEQPTKKRRIKIEPGQGHYNNDGKIYLEGPTFFEILEEDMPIQLWTGPTMANLEEKRLLERDQYWTNALVATIRKTVEKCVVHVAYLASSEDTDETVEKNVALDRIRIILGGDDSIPETLEEARLLAMGGEEIKVKPVKEEIDEATGFTSWSTVTIKKTTVRQETKEGRDRLREKRKQETLEKEAQDKEAEARRMEEAKVSNADDSALGAYDVWGQGGYKGVDIHKEVDLKVEDTAKSLASGKSNVGFKKKKKHVGSRNRRTTSADDDD
jgi:WW domain-binding protein 4